MLGAVVGRDRRATARATRLDRWQVLAAEQAGVVARRQLLELGYGEGQVGALLDRHRWDAVRPGVYLTFGGEPAPRAKAWAALLAAGPGAALGGTTALWLWGVLPDPPDAVTVCIPDDRHVVAGAGVRVVRRRRLDDVVHPSASPQRLRLEAALLDATDTPSTVTLIDLVLRATNSRRTTPARILLALAGRNRHRHRALLHDVLGEAAEGVGSALERRYLRTVERPHGLPRGRRNRQERRSDGPTGLPRNRYRDVEYGRLVVELDGLEAHPRWALHLDRRRDNSAERSRRRRLGYGWREVLEDPCWVAAEVADVLAQEGWSGRPTPCGPVCRFGTPSS